MKFLKVESHLNAKIENLQLSKVTLQVIFWPVETLGSTGQAALTLKLCRPQFYGNVHFK